MAETTEDGAKISVKVFVDKLKKRVLYAEADHSFVDILFSFMTLPLGTIVRLLGKLDDKKFEALGSLNNLYQSLKDFPECYLSTEECKFMLLNPRSVSYDLCRNLKLTIDDTEPVKYFTCKKCWCNSSGYNHVYSICNKAKCTNCGAFMISPHLTESDVCVGGGGGGVFVSDLETFIITDDFSVMPYSTAGLFGLLTDLGITDTSHLEEKKIEMDSKQMLYLLRMAVSLDSPFTSFIYHKNISSRSLSGSDFDQCDFMKKETSTSSKMVLGVTLQKSTGKLLFAEARGDFVDFLFGILSVPLGTVVGTLMNGASSLTCMDNIFKSISNMSVGSYIKSQDIKDMLLKPHFGQEYSSKHQIFPITGTLGTLKVDNYSYRLKDPRVNAQLLRPSGMFFVTDDLVISPSSSHLAINTLEKSKVSFLDIEQHEINVCSEEGLRLLKASLRSKSVLTNILKHQLKK